MISYVAGSTMSRGEDIQNLPACLMVSHYQTLRKFSSQILRRKCKDLQFRHLMESNSVVEAQHRKVYLVEWCEEECFAESGNPADYLELWQGVAKLNNFKNLASCLMTPTGKAIVERIFSLVTAIKTKPLSETPVKLLDALVRIRSHLLSNAICFNDFICTVSIAT